MRATGKITSVPQPVVPRVRSGPVGRTAAAAVGGAWDEGTAVAGQQDQSGVKGRHGAQPSVSLFATNPHAGASGSGTN